MITSSARLLQLLALLQLRREWTGAELAERLEVTDRTIRRDIDKLRDLGYPIAASAGLAGGYRLGSGARLPPLLLDDDEALAVALGLAAVAVSPVSGVSEASVRALTKLEQVLPSRLRRRFVMLKSAITRLGGPADAVDPRYLTDISAAIASRRQVAFEYEQAGGARTRRIVEPYHLVDSGQRWYLVAWDVARSDWRTFRIDRLRTRPRERARYAPRRLPAPDVADYVQQAISRAPYRYDITVRLHAPATALAGRLHPSAGQLREERQGVSILRAGWDDLDAFLGHILGLDVRFEVLGPAEVVERMHAISARLADAAGGARRRDGG